LNHAGERVDPPLEASEFEMLRSFLDYHRATLLRKVDGVSDEDLRKPMVPSGTSLLGMVKHLAYVEQWWFRTVFRDEEVRYPWTEEDPDADWRIEPDESTEQIIELYRYSCALSREITAAALPDDKARNAKFEGTMRWILLHMIEETARHNGHADILRELIDGAVGE
jgi:uncharacterized damage-inducible protein DinB